MASERQNMSEQEISIKAREHELYVQSLPEGPPGQAVSRSTCARHPPSRFRPRRKPYSGSSGIVVSPLLRRIWRVTHPRTAQTEDTSRPSNREGRPHHRSACTCCSVTVVPVHRMVEGYGVHVIDVDSRRFSSSGILLIWGPH